LLTFGCILIGGIAYFVRDWRTLELIIGVPIFATIAIFWYIFFIENYILLLFVNSISFVQRFVPESTLWLISEKRYKEAEILIVKAAKLNGKTVPPELLVLPVSQLNIIFKLVKQKYFHYILEGGC